jgi:hypothetical protein
MAARCLRDTELVEILSKSDSSSGSSSFSDSSDNEIDDLAVADAIINDDSDGEEETYKTFLWETMDNYTGQKELFHVESGPRNKARNVTDILECFELFFDGQIIQHVVIETNRYAEQYIIQRGNLFTFRSPVRSWVPVTENEIHVLLGLFLLMGMVQKPTMRSYFSKKRVLSTPGFADVISRERFELICKFLHFIDNDSLQAYDGPPKLFKIYPILRHLNNKFQSLYLPTQNIAIDESLTLWKGRLSFLQYLPLKASKFGIKTFELCESSTGYLRSFLVYTGKDTTIMWDFVVDKVALGQVSSDYFDFPCQIHSTNCSKKSSSPSINHRGYEL